MKLRKFIFSIIILTTLLVMILLFINELKSGSDDTQPSNTSTENDTNFNSVKLNKEFSDLVSVIQNSEGTFGLYIKDLSLNTEYKFNENEEFYPLSLYKIPISYIVVKDVEKGKLNWEDEIIYTRSDYYDQYGTIALSGFGSKYTVDRIIELMIRESDNTALNFLSLVIFSVKSVLAKTLPISVIPEDTVTVVTAVGIADSVIVATVPKPQENELCP